MDLAIFLQTIDERLTHLRARLRKDAPHVFDRLPHPSSRYTGDAFVDSVGTTIRFERGMGDFFYEPKALEMRDSSLSSGASRASLFADVAAQLGRTARVLNIGAGGDLEPIRAFRDAGHEIVSTDMSNDTVQALISRGGGPAFASDLVNLDELLPTKVDFVIGNSTLGYVAPWKVNRVVENLYAGMVRGGVFTFDLSPHPRYFRAIEGKRPDEAQTLVNEGDADPRKLFELIQSHGVVQGLGAMAYHSHYRAISLNLAMIQLLKERFETLGARCSTGVRTITNSGGTLIQIFTLRVSRADDNVLAVTNGEASYTDPDQLLMDSAANGKPPIFALWCIDRMAAEPLARALGIHRDARSDAWNVPVYVSENQDSSQLRTDIRDAIIADLSPSAYTARIREFLEGSALPPGPPPPTHIVIDQVLHKGVLSGSVPMTPAQADQQIDAAYAVYRERQAAGKAEANIKTMRDKEKRERKRHRRK